MLGQTDLGTGNVTLPSAAVFLRHTPESQVTRLIPYIRELTANAVPGLMQDKVSVMLVPVRETVSVPMPENGAAGTDDERLYLLAGLAGLLALACIGLAAVIYVRNRRNKAQ